MFVKEKYRFSKNKTLNEWDWLSSDNANAGGVNMFYNNTYSVIRRPGYTCLTH